jgi:putative esterase
MSPRSARPVIRKAAPALLLAACVLAGSCSRTPTSPNDASWRMLPGHVEAFADAGFRAGRKCWVYLPPSYSVSADRYPVLYVTDGEDVFDDGGQMHVNRICEDLIRQGEIRPIIVVAIENARRDQRFWELAPWHDYRFGDGGGGGQFLLGIRDTLKPSIDHHYRTLPDSANTAIAGVSLGGLFAGYAGMLYGGTFGNVAAFSPSYWLDGYHLEHIADSLGFFLPQRIRRYYQDTGSGYDNYIDGMTDVLLRDGFRPGVNFLSITAAGGDHTYGAWGHRYPEALKFLFGTSPDANR